MIEGEYSVGSTYQYQGRDHHVIKPLSPRGLRMALHVKEQLQSIINNSETSNVEYYTDLLIEQERAIDSYISDIGTFDNSVFIKNLSYLIRTTDMKLGELENLLGISAGYISRTAKENSGKRMSIDVVWKIAKLFDVNIHKLLCVDLSELKGNAAVLVKFIDKMIQQTESGKLQWEDCGGITSYVDQELIDCGMISLEGETAYYHPKHLNQEWRWIINADIMKVSEFGKDGEDMVLIPFCPEGKNNQFYDFVFTWELFSKDIPHTTVLKWGKMFYANEDVTLNLVSATHELYKTIEEYLFDPKIDEDTRSLIDAYLAMDE